MRNAINTEDQLKKSLKWLAAAKTNKDAKVERVAARLTENGKNEVRRIASSICNSLQKTAKLVRDVVYPPISSYEEVRGALQAIYRTHGSKDQLVKDAAVRLTSRGLSEMRQYANDFCSTYQDLAKRVLAAVESCKCA